MWGENAVCLGWRWWVGESILPPSVSMALNLVAKVHPVVFFTIVDSYERRNPEAHRVIGTLLGESLQCEEGGRGRERQELAWQFVASPAALPYVSLPARQRGGVRGGVWVLGLLSVKVLTGCVGDLWAGGVTALALVENCGWRSSVSRFSCYCLSGLSEGRWFLPVSLHKYLVLFYIFTITL